jgi:hypothetical protein
MLPPCGNSGRHNGLMLNKDFKAFITLLNATGVEYLVVGQCAS